MLKLNRICEIINEIAPLCDAYEWDNSGLLVSASTEVSKILVALDLNLEVIEQAKQENCELIITHHPIMMSKINKFDCFSGETKLIAELIRNNISHYAAHTTMDRAVGGINDEILLKLNAHDIKIMCEEVKDNRQVGTGRIGVLEKPLSEAELALKIKQNLGVPSVRVSGTNDKISLVAVCGGSGSELIPLSLKYGAQAFVSGEIKYNSHLRGAENGLTIFEAGHFETESCFIDIVYSGLQKKFFELQYNLGLIKSTCKSSYKYH